MSWVGAPGPGIRNDVRIQLDASCTIEDEASGDSETYYLIAPCRAEYMYRDGPMFVLPNWEFCGIWSKRDYLPDHPYPLVEPSGQPHVRRPSRAFQRSSPGHPHLSQDTMPPR